MQAFLLIKTTKHCCVVKIQHSTKSTTKRNIKETSGDIVDNQLNQLNIIVLY
jgi:hypothetical protein